MLQGGISPPSAYESYFLSDAITYKMIDQTLEVAESVIRSFEY